MRSVCLSGNTEKMEAIQAYAERIGLHRVLDPVDKSVVPQSAKKLDNSPVIKSENELLLSVMFLNLDSTR
jgi:hypothetical protein